MLRLGRRFVDRLSYATVVATLALFVSLGGASYAVITPPAHSVGQRQLKPGAVTPGALSFPLGAQSFTDRYAPLDLGRGGCVEPPPPGRYPVRCSRATLKEGRPLGHVHLRASGQILITAVAALADEAQLGSTAYVEIAIFANRQRVDSRTVKLTGLEEAQVPLQALVSAPAGWNSVGFDAMVRYYSNRGPGDGIVRSVTIIATALPAT